MKKIIASALCSILLVLGLSVLSSCQFPQVSYITVQNKSGSDITDLSLTVKTYDSEQKEMISTLETGTESKTYKFELTDFAFVVGGGTLTASVQVAYKIGDETFDISNEIDVQKDDDGNYYSNTNVSAGNYLIIIHSNCYDIVEY